MEKHLETSVYETLFEFNVKLNEQMLEDPDFGNLVTRLISDCFGYKSALIIMSEDKLINIYDNANIKKLYSTEYMDLDVKNEFLLNNKSIFSFSNPDESSRILYLEDIISFEEYEKTDFYKNVLRKHNIFYEALILLDEHTSSFSLYKSKDEGNFRDEERILITYLARVVRNAYRTWQLLNKYTHNLELLKETSNIYSTGNILVNEMQEVIDYNNIAAEMCYVITDEKNTERAINTFVSMIEDSVHFIGNIEKRIQYYTFDYRVEINVFINEDAYNNLERNYLLTLEKSQKKSTALFRKEFGITEREMDIINRIDNGMKAQEIADDLYISVNTVRSHIKHIFTKLNVSSQTALLSKYNEYRS